MTKTTTSARRPRAAAILVALALAFGAAGLVVPALAAGCSLDPSPWRSISPPFPAGGDRVSAIATLRFTPQYVYVSNGPTVVRSADGGCSFADALTLTELGLSSGARVTHMAMYPADPRVVYAVIQETNPANRIRIARTRDGGGDWVLDDDGLETAAGPPLAIAVGNRDTGNSLYLLAGPARLTEGDNPIETGPVLYRSINEGDTWEPRTSPADLLAAGGVGGGEPLDVRSIELDPREPNTVWLFGPDGLFRTEDGGGTVARVMDQPIGEVLDLRTQRGLHWVLAFHAEKRTAYLSMNGGAAFRPIGVPGVGQSAAPGRVDLRSGEFLMTSLGGQAYHRVELDGASADVSLGAGRAVYDLQTGIVDNDLVVYGRTATSLERLILPGPPILGPSSIPPLDPDDLQLPDGRALDRPTIVPPAERVELAAGQRRTVPVRLYMPGTRRVDVFFLIDASGSMGSAISGLRGALGEIVRQLNSAGVDAHFGLGLFKGYDVHTADPQDRFVYRLVRDIARPNRDFSNKLGEIGVGGDILNESHLGALYQVATGEGQASRPISIPPGQGAHFRPGALRVIVNATDEAFSTAPPNPSAETAASALRAVEALQVGLALQKENQGLIDRRSRPSADLEDMARRTGAVAPIDGLDCDGDGFANVGPGEPLVCAIDPLRSSDAQVMAPAIVNLLLSLVDLADVSLQATSDPGIVVEVSDPVRNVPLNRTRQLAYAVTIACPPSAEGEAHPIRLEAIARGATLATGVTEVVCGVRPPEIARVLPPLVFNPPPAPQPVQQSNPQSNPNPQPQGAFAAQRQQQHQLVYGYVNPTRPQADVAPAREESYSMSRARSEQESTGIPPAATLLAGAGLAMGFALAMRRRTAPALARARTTRPPRRRTW
jgi:hypothetical protein